MSCIEDILIEYDSSDDFLIDCKSINIESILKESFDECDQNCYYDYKTSKEDEINNIYILDSFLSQNQQYETFNKVKITDDEDVSVTMGLQHDDDDDGDDDKSFKDSFSKFSKARLREQSLFMQSSNLKSPFSSSRTCNDFTVDSKILLTYLLKISSQMEQNSNFKQHDPGLVTCMICNDSNISFGTSRGLNLIFDYDETIQQVLGSSLSTTSSRPFSAVTAMDSIYQGRLLVSGYESGEIILWDVAKGIILKTINELHSSSIVSIAFLVSIQEGLHMLSTAANTTDYAIATDGCNSFDSISSFPFISADREGTMYRTTVTKRNIWTSYSYIAESECLLKQQQQQQLSYNKFHTDYTKPLPSLVGCIRKYKVSSKFTNDDLKQDFPIIPSEFIHYFGSAQLSAIDNGTQTLIVQLFPIVKVVYRWDKPGIDSDSICSLDWTWSQNNGHAAAEYLPMLARCCGKSIEVLVISLIDNIVSADNTTSTSHYKQETQSSSSMLGFLQSSSSSIASNNSNSQSHPLLHETKHHLSIKVLKNTEISNYSFVSIKWLNHLDHIVVISNSSKILILNQHLVPTEYFSPNIPQFSIVENSYVIALKGQLFISKGYSVWKIQIQTCFEKANQLIDAGKWLEALAMISENVKKYPSLLELYKSFVEKYILKYTQLGLKQSEYKSNIDIKGIYDSKLQYKFHFHLVADICIEYCATCSITDFLFGQIYSAFLDAGLESFFFESLEPHIINGNIKALPQSLIQQFFNYFVRVNSISSIERCVIYLDIDKLDYTFLVGFLLDNKIYSTFLYLYSYGCNNFVEAFQIVFSCIDCCDSNSSSAFKEVIGYKLMLFLSLTFQQKLFPSGSSIPLFDSSIIVNLLTLVSEEWLQNLDDTLHKTLLTKRIIVNISEQQLKMKLKYPYMSTLSEIDADGLLDTLHQGLSHLQQQTKIVDDSTASSDTQYYGKCIFMIYQRILDFYSSNENQSKSTISEIRNKQVTMIDKFYFKFEYLISSCSSKLPNQLLLKLVNYLSCNKTHSYSEEMLILVVQHQSSQHNNQELYDLQASLIEHDFWIANLLIPNISPVKMIPNMMMYSKAFSFYKSLYYNCNETQSKSSPEVFKYINTMLKYIEAGDKGETIWTDLRDGFNAEILKSMIELCRMDLISCCSMVNHFFANHHHVDGIIENTASDPILQFKVLDALLQSCSESDLSKVHEVFQSKSLLTYFGLLCVFHPTRVLKFLQVYLFDSNSLCPLDSCFALCKEHNICDAISFLMEKMGEVSESLQLLLKDFSFKLKISRKEIDNQIKIEMSSSQEVFNYRSDDNVTSIHQILTKQGMARSELLSRLPAYKELEKIVRCISDLCTRNTLNERKQRSQSNANLWLRAFDYLLLERQTIRSGVMSSSAEVAVALVGLMLQLLMERMNGIITPQDIIRRVTAQGNATGIRLGEFKDMMLSMIYSNSQDLFLNHVMNDIFRADVCYLHKEKIKLMRRHTKYDESYQSVEHDTVATEATPTLLLNEITALSRLSYSSNKANFNYRQFVQSSFDSDVQQQHSQVLQTDIPTDCCLLIDHSKTTCSTRPGTLNKTAMYIAGR